MKTIYSKLSIGVLLFICLTQLSHARVNIWPSIPFIRGADLCKFHDAYGQTRTEYMNQMVRNAKDLLQAGAKGYEALELLKTFNNIYDRNQAMAVRHQYLDVTLEGTLKAYIDQFNQTYANGISKISFKHVNKLVDIINAARNGQRIGYINDDLLDSLDAIAYGTYALAPNCRGNVSVTIHIVHKDGRTDSFIGEGKPQTVMSQIASRMFEKYQRTQFPTTIRTARRTITLLGAMNGSVGQVSHPRMAEEACLEMGGRLPNQMELELISMKGDWNGGVSIGQSVWALSNNKVYHPGLMNPSPVRNLSEINSRKIMYYCVR